MTRCSVIYRLSEKLGIPQVYIELADKGVLVLAKIDNQPAPESILTVGTTTDELATAFRIAKSFYLNYATLRVLLQMQSYRRAKVY